MDSHKTLPFAMYDVAVYLPGGALVLVAAKAFLRFVGDFKISELVSVSDPTIGRIVTAIIWLSAAYLAGHLAAFASTYLVEKLVHNSLGYPSDVWLQREEAVASGIGETQALKAIFTRNLERPRRGWVPCLIILAQIPAALPLALILRLRPLGFYSPKLPTGLRHTVEDRMINLRHGIPISQGTRWEKIVEHFVANKCPAAYSRMYNYLVIYGALRILSFCLLLSCWILCLVNARNALMGGEFSFLMAFLLIALPFVYALSVMAFAKFNRRFFEESILAFCLAPKGLFREVTD